MNISDLEIENSGIILLNDSDAFYDDLTNKSGTRIDVIKSFESKNIVACPGSGKTTTLLAKLIILSNRMPFEDGRGICVFTHTNVAIEKIKEELGSKSDILFSYPNFFGTIQSFINRYIATPSFINKNGFRPTISNSKYYEAIKKGFLKDPSLLNIMPYIIAQAGYKHIEPYAFIANLRFNFWDTSIISSSLLDSKPFLTPNTKTYPIIKKFKEKIYGFGYIPFDEAYSEAKEYLTTNPKIGLAIQERFKYVFVDEMQDSGAHQVEILDYLFKDKKDVIFQCFGDANQALYNDGKKTGSWEPIKGNSLYINDTKRFGATISKVVSKLRINYHNEPSLITSSSNTQSLKPTIILFDETKVTDVVLKYAELIGHSGLKNEKGFYAIGRISKPPENGSFSIKAYYPEYEKSVIDISQKFNNLESYLFNNKDTIKERSNSIIDSILYLLDENEKKHPISSRRFTRKTLLKWIKDEDESIYLSLKSSIIEWIKGIDKSDDFSKLKKTIIIFYIRFFNNLWSITLVDSLPFFNDKIVRSTNSDVIINNIKNFTVLSKSGGDLEIPIIFNTVNGEKGRTHSSTLYLETYKNSYDVEKVIQFMSGEEIKLITRGDNKGKINSSTPIVHMKFAYVGMSRSANLLCVAVRNKIMTQQLKTKLITNGWLINEDLI